MCFSILPLLPHILSFGLMRIATSKNFLSKNGTRASTPQAAIALFARAQSYICNAANLRTVSSWNSFAFGALWKYK